MALMPRIQLAQMATDIALEAKSRAQSLEPERKAISARLKEIEAIAAPAKFTDKRVRNFQPEIGGLLQCPRCWVLSEAKVDLTGGGSHTKRNAFGCAKCGLEVTIEAGV